MPECEEHGTPLLPKLVLDEGAQRVEKVMCIECQFRGGPNA